MMDKSSKISKMKEITVIGKGNSFDLNYLKKIKGPIFLIAFWVPLKIDNKGNIIYSREHEALKTDNLKHFYDIINLKSQKNFKKKPNIYDWS